MLQITSHIMRRERYDDYRLAYQQPSSYSYHDVYNNYGNQGDFYQNLQASAPGSDWSLNRDGPAYYEVSSYSQFKRGRYDDLVHSHEQHIYGQSSGTSWVPSSHYSNRPAYEDKFYHAAKASVNNQSITHSCVPISPTPPVNVFRNDRRHSYDNLYDQQLDDDIRLYNGQHIEPIEAKGKNHYSEKNVKDQYNYDKSNNNLISLIPFQPDSRAENHSPAECLQDRSVVSNSKWFNLADSLGVDNHRDSESITSGNVVMNDSEYIPPSNLENHISESSRNTKKIASSPKKKKPAVSSPSQKSKAKKRKRKRRKLTASESHETSHLNSSEVAQSLTTWKCFICSSVPLDADFDGHLLFGSVKCNHCSWSAKSCDQFRNRLGSNLGCQHTSLCWSFEHLFKYLDEQKCNYDVVSFLSKYLKDTDAYQFMTPYKDAYKYFQYKCKTLKQKKNDGHKSHITNRKKTKSQSSSPSNSSSPSIHEKNQDGDENAILMKKKTIKFSHANEHIDHCNMVDREKMVDKENSKVQIMNITSGRKNKEHVHGADEKREIKKNKSKTKLSDENDNVLSSPQEDVLFKTVESKSVGSSQGLESKQSSSAQPNLLSSKDYSSSKKTNTKDKFNIVIFGVSKKQQIIPQRKKNLLYDRLIPYIPEYAIDNYVIVLRCSDACPKCYEELGQMDIVSFITNCGLVIFCCPACSLYICLHINKKNMLAF